MYMVAVMIIIATKIQIIHDNSSGLMRNIQKDESIMHDILIYLNDNLLYEKKYEGFRGKLESLLKHLADDYIK